MVHVNANIRNSIFKTQDNSAGRSWKWEEDGFTVYRGNARTGPGCHNNCGILMYVKDGILVKVEGDPENPYNQGRLCPRCLALNETVNHPDRLKYPLKRAGKRGENSWVRITWDEAYDFIEEKFRRIISEYGPEAITVMQGTGRDINGYGARLAYSLGSPNYANAFLSGLACYAPRLFACKMKAGHMMVADYSQFFPERYEHPEYQVPEYVLIWGNNPVVSNADGTLGHWIVELMKRGTKLITIDPKLTWLASRSEHFLQIRPGTDAALALAFSNVIIEENLYNKEFVENWTSGFADLAARCKEYPPEKAAKICGVSGRAIKEAARALGKARSASLQWGVALDHTSEGLGASMACMDLMALTGNIEKPGTMILSAPCFDVYQTWEIGWGHDLLTEEQAKKAMNEKFPLLKAIGPSSPDMLADAMLTGEPYPVKAAWIQTSNPLACMAADPHKAQQCLENMEFNVVVDLFMTPTALAVADIVLPAACFPERQGLSGHHPYYLGAIVQAINPLGECKSDQQIIYEMASRFNPEGNPCRCACASLRRISPLKRG